MYLGRWWPAGSQNRSLRSREQQAAAVSVWLRTRTQNSRNDRPAGCSRKNENQKVHTCLLKPSRRAPLKFGGLVLLLHLHWAKHGPAVCVCEEWAEIWMTMRLGGWGFIILYSRSGLFIAFVNALSVWSRIREDFFWWRAPLSQNKCTPC
jgi:hypothetical protein